ncbi:MAG: three-Cys-motif partner protein TcmP [Micropepsaceae bacterium]
MVSLKDYVGREQSYVKHVFLERYLERLVHKTASKFDHIVYVDGFAGPWQSASENFEDTSFGIALAALRGAKASWKDKRSVRMSAFLVERSPAAYAKLAQIPARFPDISVKTYSADFLSALPNILKEIPSDAFAFFFVDPKGWRIPLRALEPMLARKNSEVIFNFMFDFINRAASIKDPTVINGLDELIPIGGWRAKLEAAEQAASGQLTSDSRKEILVEAFRESLKGIGKYDFVAETTVLRPLTDRTLYCLFYATRHPIGIEVFRDCQIAALTEESKTRASTKIKHSADNSGQSEMFRSLHDMAPDDLNLMFTQEKLRAEQAVLELAPVAPNFITYERLWPAVLARCVVRRPTVNKIVATLRKAGRLHLPDWEKGKSVPQSTYRVQRASTNAN